ncbi:methylamine protein [Synechococcus phage ACG-2014d]|jgi:hypothetical protein|uniref:Methylamine protein n=1 Tax=Synechococcus phage ACG-2014d TaxID=1493509 RepID=A0A0E3HUU6_9CAUD|nr:methylamine utilization [Synechococcus phage ACG-2014d]YP_010355277.1 methylamine utilization [Synechococcus phage ACG-2014d]AIX14719.1 methylamine protein [Synechococcus phage ACG-2014d]AIX14938.1 methylamine protein [Synechococcus phage ACG-2014d]AIX15365.1 methylamine protein [Synechococcus phage ACG-2014d]AIX15583.1 methylamine protein [Synechococcus phage ACG-2014d]AIX16012.1 methylamine protein [Synechococcus phage ACG-2014d]
MLTYVKHDEEFHCSIKLINGDELIARALVSLDDTTNQELVYLEDPLLVQTFTKEIDGEKAVRGLGFTKWQNFSDEDFYIISSDTILTMAALSKEMVFVYEAFLATGKKDTVSRPTSNIPDNYKVTLTDNEGSLGKIQEARKKLEDLFGNS